MKHTDKRSNLGKRIPSSITEKAGLIAIVVMITVFFSITTKGLFFDLANPTNIINILQASVLTGIVAVAVTFVIISGGIDLSVAGNCVLCAVSSALMIEAGMAWPLAMLLSLGIGSFIGLVNGLAVTFLKMVPFVTTLAMTYITTGVAKTITKGRTITNLPEPMTIFGQGRLFGFLPVSVIILLVVFVLGFILLSYTNYGRKLYAAGGNMTAAWLAGIKTRRIILMAYIMAGLSAAISANIIISRLQSASLSIASGLELDVVAACVVGGTSLSGGRGSVTGTLIGVIIISMINNGLNLMGVQASVQSIAKGAIIFIVIAFDSYRRSQTQTT